MPEERFTAKDFRTWMGSVHALDALWALGPADGDKNSGQNGNQNGDKKTAANLVTVVDRVAGELGNTRAVCRSFYIHPDLFRGYEEGWLFDVVGTAPPDEAPEHLTIEEAGLMRLLEHVQDDD